MQVITRTARDIALSTLTAKQHAMAATVADMTTSELALTATAGKGAPRKVAAQMIADAAMADIVAQYRKGGCVNVAPFARYLRVITGQHMDGKSLAMCPASKAGFYAYPGAVLAWAHDAKTDKATDTRLNIHAQVEQVVKLAADTLADWQQEQAANETRTIDVQATDVTSTAPDADPTPADAGMGDTITSTAPAAELEVA